LHSIAKNFTGYVISDNDRRNSSSGGERDRDGNSSHWADNTLPRLIQRSCTPRPGLVEYGVDLTPDTVALQPPANDTLIETPKVDREELRAGAAENAAFVFAITYAYNVLFPPVLVQLFWNNMTAAVATGRLVNCPAGRGLAANFSCHALCYEATIRNTSLIFIERRPMARLPKNRDARMLSWRDPMEVSTAALR
jgi:hypothetical protein